MDYKEIEMNDKDGNKLAYPVVAVDGTYKAIEMTDKDGNKLAYPYINVGGSGGGGGTGVETDPIYMADKPFIYEELEGLRNFSDNASGIISDLSAYKSPQLEAGVGIELVEPPAYGEPDFDIMNKVIVNVTGGTTSTKGYGEYKLKAYQGFTKVEDYQAYGLPEVVVESETFTLEPSLDSYGYKVVNPNNPTAKYLVNIKAGLNTVKDNTTDSSEFFNLHASNMSDEFSYVGIQDFLRGDEVMSIGFPVGFNETFIHQPKDEFAKIEISVRCGGANVREFKATDCILMIQEL
jgi:hypothetical protein